MRRFFQRVNIAVILVAGFLCGGFLTSAHAATDAAVSFAQDVNAAVGAATSVIGKLQKKINDGSVSAADIDPDDFLERVAATYKDRTERDFGDPNHPDMGVFHETLKSSIREVLSDYRSDILAGGQDSFVPAFFRAELLLSLERKMGKGFEAVVTTREADLINGDSSVNLVFRDPKVAKYIMGLVDAGEPNVMQETIDGRLVSYFPMALRESCVSCHIRNELKHQKVGGYGGALVVSAPITE